MARSIDDMYIIHHPSLAFAGLALLTGLTTQLFIVVVNIMDWMKGRPKTPVDQILTSIGIIRICLHFFTFLKVVCAIFLGSSMGLAIEAVLYLIAHSSNLSDIWLGTLFSVIFCLKISNIHNAFFLYLKTLISQRVGHLILALILLSICYISLYLITNHIIISTFLSQNFTSNETQIPDLKHIYIFLTIGSSIPFLIYCTSSLLLIVSLCLHLTRMKNNTHVSANLTSYYKAIQFMTLCLLGFVLRIGANVVVLYFYDDFDIMWIFLIVNLFAILNSIYLIFRTNKLKDRFSMIFHHGIICMFYRRGSLPNCGDQATISTL